LVVRPGNTSCYSIRRMCRKDASQAEEIDRQAFPTMLPPPNYERELKNKLAHYIVACDKKEGSGNITGFAGLWLLVDEAHIVNIVVRENHRRQGAGELLVMHIIKLALGRGAELITLEARASNKIAQSLYRKYGFVIKGIRCGYYLDNKEDAVIMTAENVKSAIFKENLSRLEEEYRRRWG